MEQMLNREIKKEFAMNSAQAETSLVGALIAFAIAVVIAMALLPSISTSISNASLTGTDATLAGLIILVFIVVILFAGLRLAGLA